MSNKPEIFLQGKEECKKVRNQCLDGAQQPHFVPCYTIMFIASQWVASLECVTPNHYILQSRTAILCQFLSLHSPWHSNCQRNAFSRIAFPLISVCHPISSLSSGPHFCTPNSARKYWTLNSLWSWWVPRTPGSFEDRVRKANNKLSSSKPFLQLLIAFQTRGLILICTDWLHISHSTTAKGLQSKWR